MCKKLFIALVLMPLKCFAVNVGDITTIIDSNKDMVAKEVTNNTDTARFITLKVQRITSPLDDGKIIPMESKSEIMSTPANLLLPAHSKENFRIFYHGAVDDKERYYRLSWLDEPVGLFEQGDKGRVGQAMTSANINTILVVSPRKEKFSYQSNKKGYIENTGNVSFRVVAFGQCVEKRADNSNCREQYYLMPKDKKEMKRVDFLNKKSYMGVWHRDQFIPIR